LLDILSHRMSAMACYIIRLSTERDVGLQMTSNNHKATITSKNCSRGFVHLIFEDVRSKNSAKTDSPLFTARYSQRKLF
jgi:hypothetical protein